MNGGFASLRASFLLVIAGFTWAQGNFHEVLGLFLEVNGSFPDVKASLRMRLPPLPRHSLGSRQGHRELRIAQPQQGRLSSFGSRLGIVAEETPRLGRGAASAGTLFPHSTHTK